MSWTEREDLPEVKAERRNPLASPDAPVGPRRKRVRPSKPYLIEYRAKEGHTSKFLSWMDGNWHVYQRFARERDRDQEMAKAARKSRSMEFRTREEST